MIYSFFPLRYKHISKECNLSALISSHLFPCSPPTSSHVRVNTNTQIPNLPLHLPLLTPTLSTLWRTYGELPHHSPYNPFSPPKPYITPTQILKSRHLFLSASLGLFLTQTNISLKQQQPDFFRGNQ